MSILLKIIEKIKKENWCFGYAGACGTCGVMDVKKELKKYSFKDIIEAFENIDFNEKTLDRQKIDDLSNIYALITGQYTVYSEKYDFKSFEDNLQNNFPNNNFVESLIWSNSKESCRGSGYISRENKKFRLIRQQKEKEILKKFNQKEHNLRNSQYRKDLIEKLAKLDIEERIKYIANDKLHGIKFYPSILIIDAKNSFNSFDIDDLKKLQQKIHPSLKRRGPWSKFKEELYIYLKYEWKSKL